MWNSLVCVIVSGARQPRVAVVREEGSNGDREMSVSLYMAGFEVNIQSFITWSYVKLSYISCECDSILFESIFLCRCGTSTCRTCALALWLWSLSKQSCLSVDSATQTSWDQLKANTHTHTSTHTLLWYANCFCVTFFGVFFIIGWAATVAYNPKAKAEFDRFRRRDDTLSLGVCNGCQLLALLGWVGEGQEGAGKDSDTSENNTGALNGDEAELCEEMNLMITAVIEFKMFSNSSPFPLPQTLKWCWPIISLAGSSLGSSALGSSSPRPSGSEAWRAQLWESGWHMEKVQCYRVDVVSLKDPSSENQAFLYATRHIVNISWNFSAF